MRRLYKILLILFSGIAVLILSLYMWVIHHAEDVLQDLVAIESNRKLSLQVEKINFNPYTLSLGIRNAHFKTADTTKSASDYDVKVENISLQLSGLGPLIFGRNLIIESIVCVSPHVQVTKRRNSVDTSKFALPSELGKIYESILKTLHTFQIEFFLIDSGRITLINRTIEDANPVVLSDIRLQIDNFKIDESDGQQNKVLFSDKILFTTSNQHLVAADGNHTLHFSKLSLDTERKWLEIDSCFLSGKKPDSLYGEFGIFFDTLRLIRPDLKALMDRDLIKVDTALCINPDIRMSFELKGKEHKRKRDTFHTAKDSLVVSFKKLLGNIDVDYVGIVNAGIDITTKKGDKITPYTSKRNSFSIHDVIIIDDPSIPVSVGRFDLAIRDYLAYSPDSSYFVKFDSIHLLNKRIYLSNFIIAPADKNRETDYKEIKMQTLELTDISWLHLIFQNRILAEGATMIRPEINILIDKNKKKVQGKNKSIYDVFSGVRREIEIRNLYAKDALVHIRNSDHSYIQLVDFNSDILVDVLLGSKGTYEMIHSVKSFSFRRGSLKGSNQALEIFDVNYSGTNKILRIDRLQFQSADKLVSTDLEGLEIVDPVHNEQNSLVGQQLRWRQAKINIRSEQNSSNKSRTNTTGDKKPLHLDFGPVRGLNTVLSLSSEKLKTAVLLDKIQATVLTLNGDKTPTIAGLILHGRQLYLENKTIGIRAADFAIEDKKTSTMNRISINVAGDRDSMSIILPQLILSPDISKLLKKDLVIRDIELHSPHISLNTTSDTLASANQKNSGKLPKININSLTIVNPVLEKMPEKLNEKLHIGLDPSQWSLTGIRSDGNELTVEKFAGTLLEGRFQSDSLSARIEGDGQVDVGFSKIRYITATDSAKASWSANLDLLAAKNISARIIKKDSNYVNMDLRSISLRDLGVSSSQRMQAIDWVNNRQKFKISDGNVTIDTKKNHFYVSNLNYQNELQNLKVDSFSYQPALDRDQFMKTKKYQSDYIQIQTGKIDIKRYEFGKYLQDSIFSVGKVDVLNAKMHVYKDKRLPFQSGLKKPLPTTIFQHIKAKLKIDSIFVLNASITYEELNEKTLKNGSVIFSNTDALVTGIKNFDYEQTDSLRLQARSKLMDSATIRFRFSESYADTLHAFLMSLRVRPFHIPALNPMLEPLASARVDQGWVDTIKMQVIGREYVAWGKMQMEYRDLKIKLLNKGDENKLTLKTKIITWIANAFVLKTKNTKTGMVYAERVHDRGIFNYWLKIALSGILTNTGVKTNKKQERKYYRGIQKFDVPEVPDVTL